MSDDTPTQRFDIEGEGDAPTQRLEAPAATVPLEAVEARTSRRRLIILASLAVALLVALLIVLIVLLTRGDATPAALPTPSGTSTSPSPTPSQTPSASPTPSPTATVPAPPPSTDATVDDFTVSTTTVDCSAGDPVITLIWSTSNADKVYFGIDTNDASVAPFFSDVPTSGNSDTDFPPGYSPFHYTCGPGSHKYVITAVNNNGTKDTVALTVTG